MAQAQQPYLSQEQTRAALRDIIAAFELPENQLRLEEAKDNAGNDMMKMMQIVFPVTTQIQQEVTQKYGFSPDGDGAIKFIKSVRQYENIDADIAKMAAQIKAEFLPPMPQFSNYESSRSRHKSASSSSGAGAQGASV
ncbi:protein C10-like [Ptychodera flava]|uniref:protein C10-like n=1 Tax=Ptychodera flava TaxID=63121 RepID=UPI00396A7337